MRTVKFGVLVVAVWFALAFPLQAAVGITESPTALSRLTLKMQRFFSRIFSQEEATVSLTARVAESFLVRAVQSTAQRQGALQNFTKEEEALQQQIRTLPQPTVEILQKSMEHALRVYVQTRSFNPPSAQEAVATFSASIATLPPADLDEGSTMIRTALNNTVAPLEDAEEIELELEFNDALENEALQEEAIDEVEEAEDVGLARRVGELEGSGKIASLVRNLEQKFDRSEHLVRILGAMLKLLQEEELSPQNRALLEGSYQQGLQQLATILTQNPAAVEELLHAQSRHHRVLVSRLADDLLPLLTDETVRGKINAIAQREREDLKKDLLEDKDTEEAQAFAQKVLRLNKKIVEEIERKDKKEGERIVKRAEKARETLKKGKNKPARTPTVEREDEDDDKDAARQDDEDEDRSVTPTETKTATATTTARAGQTYAVEFDDNGLKNATITIQVGDTVRFRNKEDFAVALYSNPHPSHGNHPNLNHGTIAKDGEWSLTFTAAGSYGFHDHNRPNVSGTITVNP